MAARTGLSAEGIFSRVTVNRFVDHRYTAPYL
jgi:hypothetical protein